MLRSQLSMQTISYLMSTKIDLKIHIPRIFEEREVLNSRSIQSATRGDLEESQAFQQQRSQKIV